MRRSRLLTSLGLVAFLACPLLAQDDSREFVRPPKPVGEAELEPHRFEELWSSFVPDVEMRGAWLLDDAIYIISEADQMISLSATDGIIRWIVDLPRTPAFKPTIYKYPEERNGPQAVYYDEIFVVGRDSVMVIDKEVGVLKWVKDVDFPISCPAWGSFSHVMVGSWNDRVYALDKRTAQVTWYFLTNGDLQVPGSSIEGLTFVPSMDGNVYMFDPSNGERKATIETLDSISCTPIYHQYKAYVGSDDYSVYCFDGRGFDRRAAALWDFPAGAPVDGPILVFPARTGWYREQLLNKVYFTTAEDQLFAVHSEDDIDKKFQMGDQAWVVDGVEQVLARGYDNIFVRDTENRLMAIEDATGQVQFTDSFVQAADYFFTNTVLPDRKARRGIDMGGTIFLGWKNGWFMGVKEKPRY